MSDPIRSCDLNLDPFDNRRLANLCGRLDEHLRHIERQLGVEISNQGNSFQIVGAENPLKAAIRVLKSLYKQTKDSSLLSPSHVHLALKEHSMDNTMTEEAAEAIPTIFKSRTNDIKPRSVNQALYVQNIMKNDVNFGIGPAGTGKTFLAVACAVAALEQEKIRRIVLVRPAVEAGEKLGFLPGDIAQKIDPYLRPLYDSLYEMLGYERVSKLLERQVIEIASLAYMRGRTLNDAFIILDEGQNATIEQMKMFLTRLGFSSTAVVTGDITQVDLPKGKESGLKQVINMLQHVPSISFTFFRSNDVVRHPVVQKIIEAYERFENKNSN